MRRFRLRLVVLVFALMCPSIAGAVRGFAQQAGTGAISGVISDGLTHRPLGGAMVYLGIQGRGPAVRMSRQITDAKGRFVFTDLPESDRFFMNVSKAGYADGHYGDTGPVGNGVAAGLIRLDAGQWFRNADVPLFRPGAIAGVVTDERSEPVVGVRVRVLARILIAGVPHLASGALTTTDDRGRYRITGLAAGSYVVNVPSVQSSVPDALTADEIEGVARGANARPSSDETPRRNNGALELPAAPGQLLIIGTYPTPPMSAAGRPQAYPMVFFPSVSAVESATTIELAVGETRTGVDLVMRPVTTVRVTGRVEAPGSIASGLVLRLIAPGLEDLADGSEVATAVTRSDGSFAFLNVPAGQYVIDASRSRLEFSYGPSRTLSSQEIPGTPGQVPGPGQFLGGIPSGPPGTRASGSHAAGDANYYGRLSVSVGDADVTGLVVALRKAATMRGRVAFEGAGDPPGATAIFVEPADGRASLGLQSSTTRPAVGGDASFTINGLLSGEYTIRIVGLHPLNYAVKSIMAGNVDYTTRPFDASAGHDFEDVVITYTDRVANLEGHVQMDAAGPSQVSVIAFPAAREQWTKYGLTPTRFKPAPVSNAGTFKIENLPAGNYCLVAVDSAQSRAWQDPAFLEKASKIAARVSLNWGETKMQDLRVSVVK